jgi:hypothetical protein
MIQCCLVPIRFFIRLNSYLNQGPVLRLQQTARLRRQGLFLLKYQFHSRG